MADPAGGAPEETTMDPKPVETPQTVDSNINLDDDKGATGEDDFVGATLQIKGSPQGIESEVEFIGTGQSSERSMSDPSPVGLSRDRPGSAFGRASATSVGSRTSTSSRKVTTNNCKGLFFSKKPGSFENAVDWCQGNVVKGDIDGELRGAWLLTEIDHWDHEREKVVLITDKTCIIVQYDFVTSKMKSFKRIGLHVVHTVQIGDFIYPPNSLMTKIHPRDHGGVRIWWGDPANVSFGQRWNPFTSDMPSITFSHHPVLYNPQERETVTYNVDDYYESFLQAAKRAIKAMAPEKELIIKEAPILIDSYLSVTSLVFNQSFLGFNRDRNGISF